MDIRYENWTIVKKLGTGSFGSVYEIERRDFGVYKAALKVISIPQQPDEINEIRASGMSDKSISEYYSSMVEEIVGEFALMSKLKGTTNIVSYEDHQVIPHEDGIGWDIYIRMELLTPLDLYIQDNPLTEEDVARLGIDLCRALERCEKLNIIHRDIKPANIFVSEQGDFKLGDFGIARTVERTASNMSRKGTANYMAPEVYNGMEYGRTVDIYSLGLVMYRLLNHNRTAFLPPYPEPIRYQDQEMALFKRINGTPLPYPNNEPTPLGDVILKACAYEPKDRFQSPAKLRRALERIVEDSHILNDTFIPGKTAAAIQAKMEAQKAEAEQAAEVKPVKEKPAVETPEAAKPTDEKPVAAKPEAMKPADETPEAVIPEEVKPKEETPVPEETPKKKRTRKPVLILAMIAAVVLVAVLLILFLPKGKKGQPEDATPQVIQAIEDYTGKNAAAVQQQLEEAGVSVTIEETDGAEEAGTILNQSLPAGAAIEDSTALTLTASKGNLVVIPSFINLPETEVVTALEGLGLSVSVANKRLYDEAVEAENVVRIDAFSAEEAADGSEEVKADASTKKILKEGDLVEKTSLIRVYLCGVPIPEGIVGMSETDAASALSSLGFDVRASYNSQTGTYGYVLDLKNNKQTESLAPGTILKKGSKVRLIVSHYVYVAPTPVPAPSYNETPTAAPYVPPGDG